MPRRTDRYLSFVGTSRRESGGCVSYLHLWELYNISSPLKTGAFQVPDGHVEHPNGVTEVAHLTVLIPTKDLDEFERKLTSVIGFTPKIGPDDTRTWSLSTTTGSHSPHLILRTPQDWEEKRYVRWRKGSIYKVAFQLIGPEGGLLSV